MPTLHAPDAPVREWVEAAHVRRSRRSYDGTPLDAETLAAMESLCKSFRPSPVARAVLLAKAPPDIFTGIVGSYGQVTGAPSAVAIVGTNGAPGVQMSIGYTGEAIVLEATRLGLGTCWIGGYYKPTRVAELLNLGGGERVYAITPLGTPSELLTSYEELAHTVKTVTGPPRKPAEEIAPGSEDWLPWARAGVELARIAPSAVNRQPWRFRYEEGRVIVAFDGPETGYKVSKKLDCGIAMLHFELGAAAAGVQGQWERADDHGSDVARYVLV